MTDLAVTASQVQPGTGTDAQFDQGIAGATITAGQTVYLDTTTNTYKLVDVDLSAAAAVVAGIALHAALAGQPLKIQTAGDMTIGVATSMTVGMVLVGSDTAGGIMPVADLEAGDRVSILAVAKSAGVFTLRIFNSLQVFA